MVDYKLSEVRYFGKWHTYNLLIGDKHVIVSDDDGDGRIGKGDKIIEGEKEAFKKYRKIAQVAVSQFRQDLPSQLKKAADKLKNVRTVGAIRLPGQMGPLPSMKELDGFAAADFNSDGKMDMVTFTSTQGTKIEIQMPCIYNTQISDVCNTKAVDGFLRLFDN